MIRETVYAVVRQIPAGSVTSYGALGKAFCIPAVTVGKIMASVPADVPWWRVVASSGELPIGKRDPRLAKEQRDRLQSETIPFLESDRVDMRCAVSEDLLLELLDQLS